MKRFDGRHVIVTGAASGMGREVALRLAREGAVLVGIDRNSDGLAETAAALPAGTAWTPVVADLAGEQEVLRAAADAVAALDGRVDALLNIAGYLANSPIGTFDTSVVRGLWEVNFLAAAVMCREILPHMPDGTSAIVNVTSTSATKAHPWLSGYAASKGALLAFSFSLAAELSSRKIRVVAVSPGGVLTPLTENGAGDPDPAIDMSWYLRILPLWGHLGDAQDAAAAIVFAASDDARYVNGVELRVDGGSHT